MKKLWLTLLFLLGCGSAWANQRLNVLCANPGKVMTSGMASATQAALTYPYCKITVYNAGTTTLATIYADNSNTVLSNPFTADSHGQGAFYANLGRYDVVLGPCQSPSPCSGPPMPGPITIGDVLLQDITQINGTFAISGTGPPTMPCTPANAGQTYTDSSTGQIYSCTGTAWVNAIGPAGPVGPPGSAGPIGPVGPPGGSLSYPGVVSDGNNGLNAGALQGEINAATYKTAPASGICSANDAPCLAVQAACAPGGSRAVYVPVGNYPTQGMAACSNLHLRCANRGGAGTLATGAVFTVTGKNWGLYSPNADTTVKTPGVAQMTVEACGFDISTDPTNVLGAWRIQGIGNSTFIGNYVYTANNSNPAVSELGANWDLNGGDYGNDFFSNVLYDLSPTTSLGGSKGVAWYVSGCSRFPVNAAGQIGCSLPQRKEGSNENHHWGGSAVRFGFSLVIENGNQNTFSDTDGEGAADTCVVLTPAAPNVGSAAANKIRKFRCESAIGSYAGNSNVTPSKSVAVGTKVADSNGNYETVSTAGTTGASAPTWCTSLNCTTTDGTAVWTMTQIAPAIIKATGSANNYIDIYGSGAIQFINDVTGWNTYESGMIFGSINPGQNSTYGGQWTTDRRGYGKWGFGKEPWGFYDNNLFQGGIDVHGTVASDRQIQLCNFASGCYTSQTMINNNSISGVPGYTTSGAGSLDAIIQITTTTNGIIAAGGVKVIYGGTGFAVNDTINAVTQSLSSGTGAVLTVSSVGTGGTITGLTVTSGGNGGYAVLRTTAIGTAPVYIFGGASGNVAINGQPMQIGTSSSPTLTSTSSSSGTQLVNCAPGGSGTQYCGADGAWHSSSGSGGGGPVVTVPSATFTGTAGFSGPTILTVPAAGMYRICLPLSLVSPGTGSGNWQMYLVATINGVSSTPQLGQQIPVISTVGTFNAGGGAVNCGSYYLDAAAPLKYNLVMQGGTPTAASTARYGLSVYYDEGATVAAGGGGPVALIKSTTYSATTSSTLTPFYYAPTAGHYRVCAPLSIVTPGTGAANWQMGLSFTSNGATVNPTLGTTLSNTGTAGAPNIGIGNVNCASYYMDAGTTVSYTIGVSGGTPSAAPTLRYGLIMFYDGPTSGAVATVAPTTYSGTASSPSTTFYVTTTAGQYRICAPLSMVTPGTGAANWQMGLDFFSNGVEVTPVLGSTISNTAVTGTAGALNASAGSSNCVAYYMDSGSPVKYAINVSGGTPTTAPSLRYGPSLFYDAQ